MKRFPFISATDFLVMFIVKQDDFSKEIKIKLARGCFLFVGFVLGINCCYFWLNIAKMEALMLRMLFSLPSSHICSEISSVTIVIYREINLTRLLLQQYRWRTSAREWVSPGNLKIACELWRYKLNFCFCCGPQLLLLGRVSGSSKPICTWEV